MERLDKFISSQLPEISRSDAKAMIRQGKVSVSGSVCREPDRKIEPERDLIELAGRTVGYKKHLYIMMNKPAGIVCATRDGLSETVIEMIPPNLRRPGLFPAGRLDKDSTGFVLITDDGALAHRILSPKSHVKKKYLVTLRDAVPPETVGIFAGGMELDGERLMPAGLVIMNEKECIVELKEGKYHQIKRMFSAVGNEVAALHRFEIAGIAIDEKLAPGEVRELTEDEIKLLKNT